MPARTQHSVVEMAESCVMISFHDDMIARLSAIYCSEPWIMVGKDKARVSVLETLLLKWCIVIMRLDRINNETNRKIVSVAAIEDKLRKKCWTLSEKIQKLYNASSNKISSCWAQTKKKAKF